MNNVKACLTTGLLVCVVSLAGGCNEYAQKKQAMEKQWDKTSSQAQLPDIAAHIDQGRIKQAKDELVKCLRANPDLAAGHYLAGRIYVLEGRNEPAEKSFQRAVELDPEIADAWHNLGSVAVLKKDCSRALECYRKAYELEPLKTEYAISLCELYVETQQTEQAMQLLADAMSRRPEQMEFMLALAGLHHRLGNDAQAIGLYEQGLLLHGKEPLLLEPCGYLYMTTKQWDKAADIFKQLAAAYPENSDRHIQAMRLLAMSSFNAERFAEALSYYNKISVVCRDDADIWLQMAESALGAEEADKAAACAQKALKLRPAWTAGFAVLGGAQYMQGEYEDAIRSFNNVVDDEQFGSYAWLMSGKCYEKLGQTAQANSAFERLVKKQGKTGVPAQ